MLLVTRAIFKAAFLQVEEDRVIFSFMRLQSRRQQAVRPILGYLEEAQAGLKIAGRNINNLRYADDTTIWQKVKKN